MNTHFWFLDLRYAKEYTHRLHLPDRVVIHLYGNSQTDRYNPFQARYAEPTIPALDGQNPGMGSTVAGDRFSYIVTF